MAEASADPGAVPVRAAGAAAETTTATTKPAEEGGLPQFKVEYWGGQILWLVILFAALYLLLSRVFVPRLRGVRDQRDAAITGAIEEARRVRAEADAQAAAAQAEMAEARAKAQAAASDAKARAAAEAHARQHAQEQELNARLAEAETRIAASRDAVMVSLREIAAETAGVIVARLTGQAASPQELDAALRPAQA